eukprot:s6158_g2.t1
MESPVSLPSSPGTDGTEKDKVSFPSPAASYVSLPSSADGDVSLPDTDRNCCRQNCLSSIQEDAHLRGRLEELSQGLADRCSSKADQDKLRYDLMRTWQLQGSSSGWRRFQAWGVQALCQNALCKVLNMTSFKHKKFCTHLSQGFIDPPVDMRQTQNQREVANLEAPSHARLAADILLRWVYENMAEDLAESDNFVQAKKSWAGPSSHNVASITAPQRVKWLPPHTTLADLRELSMAFCSQETPPSFATFSRVYHQSWQAWLKIRTEGQHAMCSECQRFKAWRKLATSSEGKNLVKERFTQHISSMKADRRADAVIAQHARETASGQLTNPESEVAVISLIIDGMDTGKFKMPRQAELSKEMANLWRPEARFFGCLVEGITEHFFLADCDIVKDSNWDLTLVSHCLHLTQLELQNRSINLPKTLRLHADNASAELKNQIFFKWCSWLVHRELFTEILVTTFRVGHSHNKIGQRFSEVRNVLKEASSLERPDDFCAAMNFSLLDRQGPCKLSGRRFFTDRQAVPAKAAPAGGKPQGGNAKAKAKAATSKRTAAAKSSCRMKRPAAAAATSSAHELIHNEDQIELPTDTEAASSQILPEDAEPLFAAGMFREPTNASAAAGAPLHAVIEPEPKKRQRRRGHGWLPMPADAREKMKALGHSKCRSNGCPQCRQRIGLVLNEDESAWVYSQQ